MDGIIAGFEELAATARAREALKQKEEEANRPLPDWVASWFRPEGLSGLAGGSHSLDLPAPAPGFGPERVGPPQVLRNRDIEALRLGLEARLNAANAAKAEHPRDFLAEIDARNRGWLEREDVRGRYGLEREDARAQGGLDRARVGAEASNYRADQHLEAARLHAAARRYVADQALKGLEASAQGRGTNPQSQQAKLILQGAIARLRAAEQEYGELSTVASGPEAILAAQKRLREAEETLDNVMIGLQRGDFSAGPPRSTPAPGAPAPGGPGASPRSHPRGGPAPRVAGKATPEQIKQFGGRKLRSESQGKTFWIENGNVMVQDD